MALKTLLRTRAVFDLCGGDVVLPHVPPALEEVQDEDAARQARAQSKATRAQFAAADAPTSLDSVVAVLEGRRGHHGLDAAPAAPHCIPLDSIGDKGSHASALARAKGQTSPPGGGARSPTLATLTETLAVGVGLLRRWVREERDHTAQLVLGSLEECLQIAKSLPRPHYQEELPSISDLSTVLGMQERTRTLQMRFSAFINDVVARVKQLVPGGILMLPAGWLRSPGSMNDPAADDGGHCLLLVLVRNLSNEEFSLAVVNSGEGLQYHPVQAGGTAPRPEFPARQSPLVLTSIPQRRVANGGFWYLLYRQLVYPNANNGPRLLYGTLLPALNQRPLAANFGAEPEGWTQFLPVPTSDDGSCAVCLQRALQFCLRAGGLKAEPAEWSAVRMRQDLVAAVGDLLVVRGAPLPPSISELVAVRAATGALARAAADHADRHGDAVRADSFEQLRRLIEGVEGRVRELQSADPGARSVQAAPCPSGAITGECRTTDMRFNHFERLLCDDVEKLRGDVEPPRILVTVPTSTMPTAVSDPVEASACCRLVVNLLTLLANQQEHIAQSALARFALVSHFLTRILPMPLPVNHPRKATGCFWMRDMMFETKIDIMRHLCLISRHYAAVCFSLQASRETDGARIIVSAAAVAVMDALLRRPIGGPLQGSLASLHYAGEASGPAGPFGLDPGPFKTISETLLLVAPEYQALRAVVLDYFDSIRCGLADDHVVFRFGESMGCSDGDVALVEQIGLCTGMEVAPREAPLFLTGERPELTELFPELAWFRDMVFLWKVLLLPVQEMPERRRWRAADSSLQWRWVKDQFVVQGFGMKLRPLRPDEKAEGGLLQSVAQVMQWFGNYRSENKALSRASPSVLAGSDVKTEDDVLFLPHMPTFNGALGQADSELLLTSLTAPYLRIPLVLGFFTDRRRVSLLREPQLQAVLDAALFEPGPWQSPADAARAPPSQVPAPDRSHLRTPAGFLFNELLRSPGPVLEAVLYMLRVAVEKDIGRPDSANEGLILYLVRLAVRVESYMLFAVEHGRRGAYLENAGSGCDAAVRGLPGDAAPLAQLEAAYARLRRELQADVLRMLLGWVRFAAGRREELLPAACRAHAHLALLYKNVPPENFEVRDASVFLSAQVFLGFNYRWLDDESGKTGDGTSDVQPAGSRLGVGEAELFEVFEAKRGRLAAWLRKRSSDAGQVLQQVESAVTSTGAGGPTPASAETLLAAVPEWAESINKPGDFVPRKEMPTPQWFDAQPGEAFRPWLLRTTQDLPGSSRQVSLNLGQYGSKRQGIQLLPVWAVQSQDYLQAYGKTTLHCVQREAATQRVCMELIGHQHSVQRWKQDGRGIKADKNVDAWLSGRTYDPGGLKPKEAWLRQVLEPVRAAVPFLGTLKLFLRGGIPGDAAAEVMLGGVMEAQTKGDKQVKQLKEVRVQRSPPLVEVYDVMEYGRQFYRSLVFTSDTAWSFHTPSTGERLLYNTCASCWSLAAGRADAVVEPAPSVQVYRQSKAGPGRQMYLPRRFLHGLLPDALLERYQFWRSEKTGSAEHIVGNECAVQEAPTRLYVSLECGTSVVATVQRRGLKAPSGNDAQRDLQANWGEDKGREPEILVNLQGCASELAQSLARLENFSHVLVWTHGYGRKGVQRVELPRLRLSFTRNGQRLHCDQHHGYWVMEQTCPAKIQGLVAQWGGGTLLLENSAGEFIVLVSAVAEPIRPGIGDPVECFLPCQLIFRRGDAAWVSNLAEGSRYYSYPIHISGTFAFAPTLAASLYLLLGRFLTWHFAEVAAMASTVSEISTDEERQLWDRINLFMLATHHADAVACCLRLAHATAPFGTAASAALQWDTRKLLLEYTRKRQLVSANCVLSCDEELIFFEQLPGKLASTPELESRLAVLRALSAVRGPQTKSHVKAPVAVGRLLEDAGYDRVVDKTFMEDVSLLERMFATIHDAAYSRPSDAALQDAAALGFLDDLFSGSGSVAAFFSVPFPLLYELFTHTITLEIAAGDDSATLASFLLRVMAQDGTKGAGLSVLRALELNPGIRDKMPKWGSSDLKWTFGVGAFKFDVESTSKLLQTAGNRLRTLAPSLVWPKHTLELPKAASSIMVDAEHARSLRYWAPPLTHDVQCGARTLGPDNGAEFGGVPLEKVSKRYLQVEKEKHRPGAALATLRGALEQLAGYACVRAPLSKHMLDRLQQEIQLAAQPQPARPHLGPQHKLEARIGTLCQELVAQWDEDVQAMDASVAALAARCNGRGAVDWLRRHGGHLVQITFGTLVAALMAQDPGGTAALEEIRSASSNEEAAELFEDVALVLCRAVRIGQIARVLQTLGLVQEDSRRGKGDLVAVQVGLRAQLAAQQLSDARHFTHEVAQEAAPRSRKAPFSRSSHAAPRPIGVRYDPRMLVFEFLCNILLRESQVRLMESFISRGKSTQSICHQMLMGEGKTTVIAPFLAMLFADGRRLVCACMPAALLEMSRAVMVERFSSPVLPRPVLSFAFQRQQPVSLALCAKLEAATRGCAVVVATPSSVKSIFLRHVELLLELSEFLHVQQKLAAAPKLENWNLFRLPSWLGGGAGGESPVKNASASPKKGGGESPASRRGSVAIGGEAVAKVQEVRMCNKILSLFQGGVIFLDEVDLLLDPLKSELNWPLGQKVPLDLTEADAIDAARPGPKANQRQGLRYRLPFHLLDAVFVASTGCAETAASAVRRDAQAILGALADAMKRGKSELKLQSTPHVVVLSREFYVKEMLPHLAEWAALFIQENTDSLVSDADLKTILRHPNPDARVRTKLRAAPAVFLKLLGMTITWLHSILPHVLSKVHRVSYGLLAGPDLERRGERRNNLSRRLLAVPFVGKDTPSTSSEFSHPDVLIGFTILAYRFNGLREGDAHALVKVMLEEMRLESTVRYHRRAACKAFVMMVVQVKGTVRGFTEDGTWIGDLNEEGQKKRQEAMSRVPNAARFGEQFEDMKRNVWPLELLDTADPEQMKIVFSILCRSPLAVQYLLDRSYFRIGTLDRHANQLTASSQELAGPQLFGQCLGFSGTPNDLLPRPMGKCAYSKGDDGKILSVLCNADVVSVHELGPWTPAGLLDTIAAARSEDGRRPRYTALIDTGALVTGMTNFEVAEYLLRQGLDGFEGVLFLNDSDERVVLERDGYRVVKLAHCGFGPDQRFTFYDHVHTTGMDIKQAMVCTACLTLSKDMTFRDYAQGAYRMRGVGRGQHIELLVTPEVKALVHGSLGQIEGRGDARRKPRSGAQHFVIDVIIWLLLNEVRMEGRKRQLLCQQDLYNIWRSAASACLMACPKDIGLWLQHERTKRALGELCVKLDFTVSGSLPGEDTEGLEQKLRREAAEHLSKGQLGQSVWQDEGARDKARALAEEVIGALQAPPAASGNPLADDELGPGDLALTSEQVQEQEEEKEAEAEEEQEEEVEFEEETEKVLEAPADWKFSRENERASPWSLHGLATTLGPHSPPFYPLADFAVNKGIFNQSCAPLQGLPGYVLLSDNYCRRSWRLTSVRRLRNIICFLEWVPSSDQLKRLKVNEALSPDQRARLREAFELYGHGSTGSLDRQEVRMLFQALDLDLEGEAVAASFASGSVSVRQIEEEVSSQALYKMQQGRFYVALSMEEAEHLRGSLHHLTKTNWPGNCGIALRCIGNKESGIDDSLIDAYGPVLDSTELKCQLELAEQLFRFANCTPDFQRRELNILLRALQLTKVEDRLPWWLDTRSCRRRAQKPWQQLPLAKVFVKADEFDELATKALLSRMRWLLATKRLWPADAFRVFDKADTGALRRMDFQAGLVWLGMQRTTGNVAAWAEQVDALFNFLDKEGKGLVSLEEFRVAMELKPGEWEALSGSLDQQRQQGAPQSEGKPTDAAAVITKPKPKRAGGDARVEPAVKLAPGMCTKLEAGHFKLKWQPHTKFGALWTSAGQPAKSPLSIWAPGDLDPMAGCRTKMSKTVKERLAFGHHACAFFGAPVGVLLLEVTDKAQSGLFGRHHRSGLRRFVDLFFPHPLRFRQVWRQQSSSAPLCVWEPIPPAAEYIALGMLVTVGTEAPRVQDIRCVPRQWASRVEADRAAVVWTDTGTDGSPACFWAADNGNKLFAVTAGATAHIAPEMHVMATTRFFASLPPGL